MTGHRAALRTQGTRGAINQECRQAEKCATVRRRLSRCRHWSRRRHSYLGRWRPQRLIGTICSSVSALHRLPPPGARTWICQIAWPPRVTPRPINPRYAQTSDPPDLRPGSSGRASASATLSDRQSAELYNFQLLLESTSLRKVFVCAAAAVSLRRKTVHRSSQ